MKMSELRRLVVDLNDGEEPDYETSIITAANLALWHLNRIIPSYGTALITQDGSAPPDTGGADSVEESGGEFVEYDMRAIADDFISFTSPPGRSGGAAVPGCIYRGASLLVPASERGRITVRYKRKPRRITLESAANDEEIDLDPECDDLLALLTAYHISLEDNRSRATTYLEQFNRMAALANAQRFKDRNDRVYTLYGW